MTAEDWYYIGLKLSKDPSRHQEAENAYRTAIQLKSTSPSPWYALGTLLFQYPSRHPEAEEMFRVSIQLDECNSDCWNGLASLISYYPNRFQEAQAAFHTSIKLNISNSRAWNGLGVLLSVDISTHQEAEKAFRNAINIDNNWAFPWNGLGNLFSKYASLYQEAENSYLTAIQLNENFSEPRNGLANLLSKNPQRHQQAEEEYRIAIKLGNITALTGLGNLLYNYPSRSQEAEETFLTAIKLNENDPANWSGLGSVLSRNFLRHQEAENAFLRAIDLDQSHVYSKIGLGSLLIKYPQRHLEAEELLRKAIELDENLVASWFYLGQLLSNYSYRYIEAEIAYQNAIKLDQNDHASHFEFAKLISNDPSRYFESEASYKKAIQIDEKIPIYWNGFGNFLSNDQSRHQDAEQAYLRAIKLDENFMAPWLGLGNILSDDPFRQKDAENAYNRAIQLDEMHPFAWFSLGNLLLKYEMRFQEAKDAFEKTIELDGNLIHPWIGLIKIESSQNGMMGRVEIGKIQKALSIASLKQINLKAIIKHGSLFFNIVEKSDCPLLLLRLNKEFNVNGLNFMSEALIPDLAIQELLFFAEAKKDKILKAAIYFYGGDAETCFQILDNNESVGDNFNYQYQYYLFRSALQYYNITEAESVLRGVFDNFRKDVNTELQGYYAALLHLEYYVFHGDTTKLDDAIEIIEKIEGYQEKPHIWILYLIVSLSKDPDESAIWDSVMNFFIEESKTDFFGEYLSPVQLNGENHHLFLHAKELSLHIHKLQNLNRPNQYHDHQWSEDIKLSDLFEKIESKNPFDVWQISPVAKEFLLSQKEITKESWLEEIEEIIKKDVSLFSLLRYSEDKRLSEIIALKMEDLVVSDKKLENFLTLIDYFKLKDCFNERERNLLCIYARICLNRKKVIVMDEVVIKSIICKISQTCLYLPDVLEFVGFFDDSWNSPMSERLYNYLRGRFEDKTISNVTFLDLKEGIEFE